MNILLTWDLVLISVLLIVFLYNFLLGQKATIKIIISNYIAILTADGVVDFFEKFLLDHLPGIQSLIADSQSTVFMVLRIVLFALAILIFVVRGGFHVNLAHHDHWMTRTAVHAMFSLLSANLFVATILIYLSGDSFIQGMAFGARGNISIYQTSQFAQMLMDYYQLWFSLPAVAFLTTSFFFDPTED
ncbi:hypothetical protein CSB37_02015 [bacterium DOLZORAL124_38_8]|nr:MAG: hypothetical protein CSB37_02015 [bacterium DOLZORAL124_38_8]